MKELSIEELELLVESDDFDMDEIDDLITLCDKKIELYGFSTFIDYNIIDVLRVEQINEKTGYLNLVFAISYMVGCNYVDTMGTIRAWDILIHNYLMDRGIAIPPNVEKTKDRIIAGGYVKEPVPGRYKYVISFDFTSLYPHLCMTFNISPETLIGKFGPIFGEMSVEKILRGDLEEYRDDMIDNNSCVSGMGTIFSREEQGFVPAIMEMLFTMRKQYTKLEEDADKTLAVLKTEKDRRNTIGG